MTNYVGEYRGKAQAIYHLEDTTDSSGNGYNLTNINSVTFTPAKIANGANLGSANTNKKLSINSNLGITGGAITVRLFVKLLAEISSGQWLFCQQYDNTNKDMYFISYEYNSGTRRLRFSRNKNGVGSNDVYFNITMGTNNFYRLALTYDNTNLCGYVNGTSIGSIAASGNGTTGYGNAFNIGYNGPSNDSYASALIDEVIVNNVALSAAEIRKDYAWATGRLL